MEACINDIRIWMKENKLKLNEDKTELLIIRPAKLSHKVTIDSIKIGDCIVQSSSIAKNLGATFDQTMSLDPHITSLVRTCNFQLRSIGQARKYLTTAATEKVIHAFISSRLDCGNSLLKGLPDYQLQRLQRIQNSAARILTRTKKFDHISPILRSLHWLKVSDRIDYKILTLTYKSLHDKSPRYIQELLEPYIPNRSLRSGDHNLLVVPKTRLVSYGDRSFQKCAPSLWNSLPLNIRNANSLTTFKSLLKTYLMERAEDTTS